MTTTRPRHQRGLTGERPRQGATPSSLLALHDAGYRAVLEQLEQLERLQLPAPVRVLDVGCGEGFESRRFAGGHRQVLGVDYAHEATEAARRLAHDGAAGSRPAPTTEAPVPVFSVAQMDARALGLADGAFDAVCSSHLVEHFSDPSSHVAELARVTAGTGTAFLLTPNAPRDFENPFHVRLFGPEDLGALLCSYFEDVWVGGLDASERVKADFAARRAKAAKLLRLDVLDLRHRIPRSWYVALYTRLLPLAYAVLARGDRRGGDDGDGVGASGIGASGIGASGIGASGIGSSGIGASGIGSDDWSVTDDVNESTFVLFAVCRRPRR